MLRAVPRVSSLGGLVLLLAACAGESAPSAVSPTATLVPAGTESPVPMGAAPERIVITAGEPVTAPGAVLYVDLETGAVEGWVLPSRPDDASVSPDGRHILYPEPGDARDRARNPTWRLLDTLEGTVCEVKGVSGWAGWFSPDGQRFLVDTPEGVATLATDHCGSQAEPLGLPGDVQLGGTGAALPADVWWAPDGQALLVWPYPARIQTDGPVPRPVYVIAQGAEAPLKIDIGEGPWSPGTHPLEWSPDSSRLAVTRDAEVRVLDRDGRVMWSTSLPGSSVGNVRWSPDARLISVHVVRLRGYPEWPSDVGPPSVYILEADTGTVRFRLPGASACWGSVWTADGRSLIVQGQRAQQHGHFVVTADGSSVHRLESADAAFFVEASPVDPERAAFLGRRVLADGRVGGVSGPVTAIDLPSDRATPVVEINPEAQAPGWDPLHRLPRWLADGRLVFFTGHGGHGGCEMGPGRPDLKAEFPPFGDAQ